MRIILNHDEYLWLQTIARIPGKYHGPNIPRTLREFNLTEHSILGTSCITKQGKKVLKEHTPWIEPHPKDENPLQQAFFITTAESGNPTMI